jgi:hypothetical protein
MSDLRNLLLDCRSALRRANRRFDEDPLRAKLDKAINEFTKDDDDDVLDQPETTTAQQVAYAWQIAIRSVSLTHPELYAKLSRRVTEMLDAKVLTDSAAEFLQLESRLEGAAAAQRNVEKELGDLRQALADAVSLSGDDAIGTESEFAYRRIQFLIDAASRGSSYYQSGKGNSGGGNSSSDTPPKPPSENPADFTHDSKDLQAVAQGKRALSRWERSWCLAEALVMTGESSEQLNQLKDSDLVKLVLANSAPTTSMPQLPGF